MLWNIYLSKQFSGFRCQKEHFPSLCIRDPTDLSPWLWYFASYSLVSCLYHDVCMEKWPEMKATAGHVSWSQEFRVIFFLGYLFPPSLLGDILVSIMRLQDLTARPPSQRLFKQFWTSQCLWLPRFSQQYPHVEGVWHRLLPLQAGRAEGKHTCWWPVLMASSV